MQEYNPRDSEARAFWESAFLAFLPISQTLTIREIAGRADAALAAWLERFLVDKGSQ